MMWRHYAAAALRNLERHRLYGLITIGGIAVGLAACALLLVFIRYQLSFDRDLPAAGSIYQVQSEFLSDNGAPSRGSMGPWPAAVAFKQDFSDVESATATLSARPILLRNGGAEYIENALVADRNFFRVLELPFVRGDPQTAIAQPNGIVFTESEALRRFGTIDIVGRTLSFQRGDGIIERRVTGILRDLPEQSHLRFNAVIAFDPTAFAANPQALENWGNATGWTYIRLRAGADASAIEHRLGAFVARHVPPTAETGWRLRLHLVPARDVYLFHSEVAGMRPGGDYQTVKIFAIVAFLILGIATINFTNLATARATRRAREVGIRKALGASRRQLITQFLAESVLISMLGVLLALAIAELLLPAFAALVDAPLKLAYTGSDGILMPMLALGLFVGFIGGAYPAFRLSAFRPDRVLKSAAASEAGGPARIRSALVIAQFAVSIGLIVCTFVIAAQARYMRNFDPGYQRAGLLVVHNARGARVREVEETLRREIGGIEGVLSVARSSIAPAQVGESNMPVQVPGRSDLVGIGDYSVDPDFFRTMQIRTVAGRTFSDRFPADDATSDSDPATAAADPASITARGFNAVISEDAIAKLGFASAQKAIGRQIGVRLNSSLPFARATIIGVVAPVQYRSARDTVAPILYTFRRDAENTLLIRYRSDAPASVRDRVAGIWRRLLPQLPFEAEFADDSIARLNHADEARGFAFAGFSTLAILIACLGLFGLAAFSAEQRTREIGVRKVFGATSGDIIRLLVWQFTRPVILANLLAWPSAWWAMRMWLNGFNERIELGPVPFLLASLLALVIAIGTIAGHAFKVARTNPILALRYE